MGDVPRIEMHDMFAMLQQLQQENANLRSAMEQLQVAPTSSHVPAIAVDPASHAPKEPRVALPDKFDGDRTKLRDLSTRFGSSSVSSLRGIQRERYESDSLERCSQEPRHLGFLP